MPRKRLSDSEKKRTKDAYNRKYYKLHSIKQYYLHLKIDLNQKRRWNFVKEMLNVNTDEEVLNILLDSYCGKEESIGLSSQTLPNPSTSKTNTTGTPIVKTHALLPYLSEISSIQSSDSDPAQVSGVELLNSEVKVEKSTLPTDLNQTYDPHDITQDIKIEIE